MSATAVQSCTISLRTVLSNAKRALWQSTAACCQCLLYAFIGPPYVVWMCGGDNKLYCSILLWTDCMDNTVLALYSPLNGYCTLL